MKLTDITVQEFTTPLVVTIAPQATLDEALEIMHENQIRHLPVVNAEKVIGLISERDLLCHIGKSWSKLVRVGDVMTTDLLAASLGDNLGEVAYQLSSQKKGSVIVLDEAGDLFGIFTTTDALNALVELLNPMAREKSDLTISL